MEDIDGGLHPAVDGQSLDEDEDEDEDEHRRKILKSVDSCRFCHIGIGAADQTCYFT